MANKDIWTDKDRELIIYMKNMAIKSQREFYDAVLDGEEEALQVFTCMIRDVMDAMENGVDPRTTDTISDETKESYLSVLTKLIDGES